MPIEIQELKTDDEFNDWLVSFAKKRGYDDPAELFIEYSASPEEADDRLWAWAQLYHNHMMGQALQKCKNNSLATSCFSREGKKPEPECIAWGSSYCPNIVERNPSETVLTEESFATVMDSLKNPPKANDALRELMNNSNGVDIQDAQDTLEQLWKDISDNYTGSPEVERALRKAIKALDTLPKLKKSNTRLIITVKDAAEYLDTLGSHDFANALRDVITEVTKGNNS